MEISAGCRKYEAENPDRCRSFEEKYGYKPEALANILKDIGPSSSSAVFIR